MAIEKSRKLLNRAIARWVRFMNGQVITHDRIRIGNPALYRNDGVHLSDQGNDIWSKMWLFWGVACLVQQALTSEEFSSGKHLNPQEFMKIPEIIQYWGYPSEEYTILTEDGYYLQANRIPHGRNCSGKTGPRPVALLIVDIILEGRSWIANLPGNSLAFVLADAGYDVWILNNRGTTWSRRHKHFSIFQKEFWNFSFHETAIYDIPAAINFILQKTEQKSLYYMGFSQGGSMGLIAFSTMPQLAKKVKLFMAFAPIYILVDTRGLFSFLLRFPDVLKRVGMTQAFADPYI
ncbi:lipase member M-like [Podarcis raffonei]|uniref:lipase member M-like n=1 Tax=Podarcis raffonei TaxID=65483 RepID=UPI00232941CA|nr:lipase member M-like [Podarcis raffonei]